MSEKTDEPGTDGEGARRPVLRLDTSAKSEKKPDRDRGRDKDRAKDEPKEEKKDVSAADKAKAEQEYNAKLKGLALGETDDRDSAGLKLKMLDPEATLADWLEVCGYDVMSKNPMWKIWDTLRSDERTALEKSRLRAMGAAQSEAETADAAAAGKASGNDG